MNALPPTRVDSILQRNPLLKFPEPVQHKAAKVGADAPPSLHIHVSRALVASVVAHNKWSIHTFPAEWSQGGKLGDVSRRQPAACKQGKRRRLTFPHGTSGRRVSCLSSILTQAYLSRPSGSRLAEKPMPRCTTYGMKRRGGRRPRKQPSGRPPLLPPPPSGRSPRRRAPSSLPLSRFASPAPPTIPPGLRTRSFSARLSPSST